MKERNMSYRDLHNRIYKNNDPILAAVESRSEARGWAALLILVVAILTLIFA